MGGGLRYGDLSEIRERLSPEEERFEARRRTGGLFAGPLLFLALLAVPPWGEGTAARLPAVAAWILVWWITEAVPIPVTALLAPTLLVLLRIVPAQEALAPFGDPVIFLFLGSFLLAEAMMVHGLDRRFALLLLASPRVGSSPRRLLFAFCLLALLLSMWLSNSATTAMLYPIALGVLATLRRLSGEGETGGRRLPYGTGLLLACAFASSAGGIGTPVGTPPNLIALGFLEKVGGVSLSFFQWMALTLPLVLLLCGALFVVLALLFPAPHASFAGLRDILLAERRTLPPLSRGEKNTLLAFLLAVLFWILPGVVALAAGAEAPVSRFLKAALPEGIVALGAASLLFVLPVDFRRRTFTLTWNQASRIDWGTLLLFGGGLSLGSALFRSGLAEALGGNLVALFGARSPLALSFLFTAVAIVVTEAVSNTAAATVLVPLAIAAAKAAGVSPLEPAVSCALGCSMAFMLPVSTPPNAIVYGSGEVRILDMAKAGLLLDLLAFFAIPLLIHGMAALLLPGGPP
jgi:sodium-dependent dicarboxylate transporter 2/3/5